MSYYDGPKSVQLLSFREKLDIDGYGVENDGQQSIGWPCVISGDRSESCLFYNLQETPMLSTAYLKVPSRMVRK